MIDLAYVLPPRPKKFDGTLRSLRQFSEILSLGETDSGGCGCEWLVSAVPGEPSPGSLRIPHAPDSPPPATARKARRVERTSIPLRRRTQGQNQSSGGGRTCFHGMSPYCGDLRRPSSSSRSSGLPDVVGAWPVQSLVQKVLSASPGARSSPSQAPRPPNRSPDQAPDCSGESKRLVRRSASVSPRHHNAAMTSVDNAGAAVAVSSVALSARGAPTEALAKTEPAVASARTIRANRKTSKSPAAGRLLRHLSLDEYVSRASAELLNTPGIATLLWSTSDNEAERRKLRPGEFFNHFRHNKELTTKTGLARNLALFAVASDTCVDRFFPRCYDLSQRAEREDFIMDFRRSAAVKVALLYLRISTEVNNGCCEGYICNRDVLLAVERTLRTWQLELEPEYFDDEEEQDEKNACQQGRLSRDETEFMWDALVLYSELEHDHFCLRSLECGDEIQMSHPMRRHHRIGGGDLLEGYPRLAGSDSAKRQRDLRLWPEFRGHSWGSVEEVHCDIHSVVARLEKLFKQWPLQGGWLGRNVWIVKPGTCSKGSGVECMSTLPELMHHCDTMPNRVVQKYIERPLLLFSGRKFDIRQWVLVRSVMPLRIFIFSECYLRLCNGMYDLGDLRDRERHISNWQVNKHGRNVVDGAVVSLADFKSELLEITGRTNFWEEHLVPQMCSIVTKTLRAVDESLEPRPESFELFGFDLMVDETMQMWLLEVNLSPGCEGRTPFLDRMLKRMSQRLIEVAVLGREEPDGDQPDWVKVCDDLIASSGSHNNSVGCAPAAWVAARADMNSNVAGKKGSELAVQGIPLRRKTCGLGATCTTLNAPRSPASKAPPRQQRQELPGNSRVRVASTVDTIPVAVVAESATDSDRNIVVSSFVLDSSHQWDDNIAEPLLEVASDHTAEKSGGEISEPAVGLMASSDSDVKFEVDSVLGTTSWEDEDTCKPQDEMTEVVVRRTPCPSSEELNDFEEHREANNQCDDYSICDHLKTAPELIVHRIASKARPIEMDCKDEFEIDDLQTTEDQNDNSALVECSYDDDFESDEEE